MKKMAPKGYETLPEKLGSIVDVTGCSGVEIACRNSCKKNGKPTYHFHDAPKKQQQKSAPPQKAHPHQASIDYLNRTSWLWNSEPKVSGSTVTHFKNHKHHKEPLADAGMVRIFRERNQYYVSWTFRCRPDGRGSVCEKNWATITAGMLQNESEAITCAKHMIALSPNVNSYIKLYSTPSPSQKKAQSQPRSTPPATSTSAVKANAPAPSIPPQPVRQDVPLIDTTTSVDIIDFQYVIRPQGAEPFAISKHSDGNTGQLFVSKHGSISPMNDSKLTSDQTGMQSIDFEIGDNRYILTGEFTAPTAESHFSPGLHFSLVQIDALPSDWLDLYSFLKSKEPTWDHRLSKKGIDYFTWEGERKASYQFKRINSFLINCTESNGSSPCMLSFYYDEADGSITRHRSMPLASQEEGQQFIDRLANYSGTTFKTKMPNTPQ